MEWRRYTLILREMQHEEEVWGKAWAWFLLGAEDEAGLGDGDERWAWPLLERGMR